MLATGRCGCIAVAGRNFCLSGHTVLLLPDMLPFLTEGICPYPIYIGTAFVYRLYMKSGGSLIVLHLVHNIIQSA